MKDCRVPARSWSGKRPEEILSDLNQLMLNSWMEDDWAAKPQRLLFENPDNLAALQNTCVPGFPDLSLLSYVSKNNVVGPTLEFILA